jgi:hypothetical protein
LTVNGAINIPEKTSKCHLRNSSKHAKVAEKIYGKGLDMNTLIFYYVLRLMI